VSSYSLYCAFREGEEVAAGVSLRMHVICITSHTPLGGGGEYRAFVETVKERRRAVISAGFARRPALSDD
jgi:hypothetical protein